MCSALYLTHSEVTCHSRASRHLGGSSDALPNQFCCQTSMLPLLAKKLSPEAHETCPLARTCFWVAVTFSMAAIQKHRNEILVELTGIEPVTPCLQSRCSPS